MPTESLDTRVALLEERVHNVIVQFEGLDRLFTIHKETSSLEQRVALLEAEVDVLENKLKSKVDQNEFWPVKTIMYGLTGTILMAVIATILYTIGLRIK